LKEENPEEAWKTLATSVPSKPTILMLFSTSTDGTTWTPRNIAGVTDVLKFAGYSDGNNGVRVSSKWNY